MSGRPVATGPGSRRRPRPDLTLPLPRRDPSSLAVPHPLPLPPPSAPSSNGAVGGDSALRSLTPSPLIADLERVRRIGSGNGGTVWMVRHRVNGQIYALKHIHGHHENEVLRHIRREVLIMRNADNPSVVRCHGSYDHGGEIQILLEYMDGGSLEGRRIADEAQLADVARQVLNGLVYLHRRRIVHRDIKPSNLLINRAREVKIADFGVGRILAQTLDPCESAVGTIAYMSPERINTEINEGLYDGQAGDIWSFGLSILEFYLGHFAYGEQLGRQGDWASLMMAICYGEPPKAPPSASPEFQDFISCCLQKDPRRRLKAAQLLCHPFITRSAGPSDAASVRGA